MSFIINLKQNKVSYKKHMPLSLTSKTAVSTLGQLIKLGRQQQPFSQNDLAIRLGVSRQTVIEIEKGNPTVAIGTVFEAAVIVGVPLLSEVAEHLTQWQAALTGFQSVLPARTHTKKVDLKDDF